MIEELKTLLKRSGSRNYAKHLKNNFKLFSWVNYQTSFLPKDSLMPERVWNVINNIDEQNRIDICGCGGHKSFDTLEKGYRQFCGLKNKCSAARNEHREFMRKHQASLSAEEKLRRVDAAIATFQDNYGVDNPMKSHVILDQCINNNIEKYGVKSTFERPDVIKKIEETNISRYGYKTPLLNETVREKGKLTCMQKYNEPHAMSIARQAFLDQNNGLNPFQVEEIIAKMKETNLKKYGREFFSQSSDFTRCIRETSLKLFDRENHSQVHIPKEVITLFNDKVEFEKLYEKHAIAELARMYKVTWSYVARTAEKHGLPSPGKSSYENAIETFLKDNDIIFDRNIRTILQSKKELDFYIPSNNLAIEICGLYWHCSERIHRGYHRDKMVEANKLGIRLITIFEDEWLNNSEIVKKYILNILGKNKQKIYARNTKIVELTFNEIEKFLDAYHLQGKGTFTEYNIGLKQNDNLVAVMTFSSAKKRKYMGGQNVEDNSFELVRFVSGDEKVIGAASKLMKYFIKKHNPKEIYSFADARWSEGQLYKILGFDCQRYSHPTAWYFKDQYKRYHHMNSSKMKKDKRFKVIYDCGKYRFTWTRK